MAKKTLLLDKNNNAVLPITRGELVLDSSGNPALRSNEFLATASQPGLMSAEDKYQIANMLASAVANALTLKINNGSIEGTNLYTFNGSAAKTLNIVAGDNITLTPTAGVLSIAATMPATIDAYTKAESDARYLKLTGGTIEASGADSFTIHRTSASNDPSVIRFNLNGKYLGRFGFNESQLAVVQVGGDTNYKILLHSGNIASYLPTVTDYYWANVKISNEANPATNPTFGNINVSGNATATSFVGNLDGQYVNKLTDYTKATSISAIATTDSLNTALGKLELKADTAYTLVAGAYDGDGTIENLAEILKVLEGISDTETIQAIVGKYLPLSGGTMNNDSVVKFTTYGNRFLTVSGNSLDFDYSTCTGGWAGGLFLKDSKGVEHSILRWDGGIEGLKYTSFNGGNVGIGTTKPAYKLDVNGIIHASEFKSLVSNDHYKMLEMGVINGRLLRVHTAAGISGVSGRMAALSLYEGESCYGSIGVTTTGPVWINGTPTRYELLHSGNYNSYSPKLDGTGATGTWGINISGNANTATSSTSASYSRNLLGRTTSGTDYSATDGNLVFAEWNTHSDNRWYLKAKGYETRVGYANNSDKLDGVDSTGFLRQVVVANNTTNDFNTFENMTLTGRVDPTTGASLVNAPWTGGGPAGGYGVLTYLFNGSGYGTQMAWGYSSNRIYIRNRYWGGSGVGATWRTSWDTLALTSDIPTVTNYYWANVQISDKSNSSTSPTFATATAGQFIANNSSGPHFTGTSTAGNWAYLRLNNSSVIWDIATRTTSGSGGLWLSRYSGLDNGIFVSASSTPKVGINLSSPSDVLDVAGIIRSTANSRYLRLGPQNNSHAHYETNADISHWFNKMVEVNGVVRPYSNNAYTSGDSSHRWSNVYSYAGNFTTNVNVGGHLILKGSTSANMTYDGNVHGALCFENSDSSQNVRFIFTDYDSYRSPAGIKLVGNQGGEWFETSGVIYASGGYPVITSVADGNGYPALLTPSGSSNWIRVSNSSSYGLLPNQSGGAGSGHGYLGTSSWYFKYAYIDQIYGYLNGNVSGSATKLTTTSKTAWGQTYWTADGVPTSISGNLTGVGSITMLGSINYAGTKATYAMIKFIDNTSDGNGNGIAIGGGGTTIVGSGEAADLFISAGSGGTESLILASDRAITFYSNCQSTSKSISLDTNGYLNTSYIYYGGHEKNASNPSYVAGFNSSDKYIRSYATSSLNVNYASSAGNADTLDNLHASSFGIWRGNVQTDPEADDTTYTNTADFLKLLHNRSGIFDSAFGAFRGSWWYVGNANMNTGVGTLEMAGTAVLNISGSTSNNEHSKTLLFIEGPTGNLYSYVKQSDGYSAVWSRYLKTTETAAWASGASTVTVGNSDYNSTYRMVWHSGNTLYGTGGIYCNPSTDYLYAASMNASDWFRSSGNTGWYNPTNECHVYPNNISSYGGLILRGVKSGYHGFLLGTSTGYMNLMDNGTDKGLYQENQSMWILYYNASKKYVGIRTSSLSYPLTINGDSYTNGWSRAANGFYVHDTGVHFTHQGTLGEIDMTSNNEFLWGSSSADLYFNYRAVSRGTTVTTYRWHAGSSTSYASHVLGKVKAQSTASSWLDGQRYERGGFNLMDATDTGSYWPWMRQTNTGSSKWFSMGVLGNCLYFIGSATSRTANSYDYGFRMDFSNGYLYGNFSGYLSGTAYSAEAIKDSNNGTRITACYSTGGFSSNPSWLAAWNGYHLTYVSPGVLSVNYATSAGSAGTSSYISYTNRAGKGNGTAQFAQYSGSTDNPTNDWYSHIIMNHANSGGYYTEIATCFHSDSVYFRRQANGSTNSWKKFAWTSDIPSVGNGTITITLNGTTKGSFTVNQSGNTTIALTDNNTNTTYSAGTGLSLSSTTFSLASRSATTSTLYIVGCTSSTSALYTGTQSTSGVRILSGNAVYAYGGFYELSDERLKNILNPIKVDLDELSKLRKIYYLWKENSDESIQLGVIAQDVQKLYPELVGEDEFGLLSVAYDKLSVIALEAIDTLYQEHKQLKKRVDELEKLLTNRGIL